ncbi:MAG: FHA domain-containing protein, partial [Polyangiaceae bacterium]|nr:FHA domain-containing protein [Polyangiaceae bacterium]
MSKAVLTFTITQEGGAARTETVSQDIIKVGKDPNSHLSVDDELASRMHAVVEVGGVDDISIIDLGNEPATQVNGAPVSKSKLNVNDVILIGKTSIKLDSVAAVGAQAQPAAAPPAVSSNPFAAGGAGSNPFGAPAGGAASNPFASPGGAAP